MVHNFMETLVDNALKSELTYKAEKYTDICQCPVCITYIKCVALNNLSPFYVTGKAGEIFGQYKSKELQVMSDVMVAIGHGIDALQKSGPHCNRTTRQ